MYQKRDFWLMFRWSFFFFFIYSSIHVLLNLYGQGSDDSSTPLDTQRFVVEISGPITIGIYSSLLLFSFGLFLANGVQHISVYVPRAYLQAYVLLTFGLVASQLAGHSEIWILNQKGQDVNPALKFFAACTCFFSLASVLLLDDFRVRVLKQLTYDLAEHNFARVYGVVTTVILTSLSLVVFTIKVAFPNIEIMAFEKFTTAAVAILLEAITAGFMVWTESRHIKDNRRTVLTR